MTWEEEDAEKCIGIVIGLGVVTLAHAETKKKSCMEVDSDPRRQVTLTRALGDQACFRRIEADKPILLAAHTDRVTVDNLNLAVCPERCVPPVEEETTQIDVDWSGS